MDMSKIAVLSFCISLLASTSALAASHELFIPVESGKAIRIEEYNGASLKKKLYASARHRIVDVDEQVLLAGDSPVTISLFDGGLILVTPTEVRRRGSFVSWFGQIEMPVQIVDAIASEDWASRGTSSEAVVKALATVRIVMMGHDVNPETGEASLSPRNSNGPADKASHVGLVSEEQYASAEREVEPFVSSSRQLDAFYSITADFVDPSSNRRYVLEPLKFTPKYSVFYEVDPSKQFPVNIDSPAEEFEQSLSAEQKANRERYEDFVKSLPQTPKTSTVTEDLQ